MKNPSIQHVVLFISDEKSTSKIIEEKRTVTECIKEIENYFFKIPIKVNTYGFKMNNFHDNVYKMSEIIIEYFNKYKVNEIVLDISTSRVPIKMALSRAGEIVRNYFLNYKDKDISIKCAMRPQDSTLVEYYLHHTEIPKEKEKELLKIIPKYPKFTQTSLATKLEWNQGEVSKSMNILKKIGLAKKSKDGYEITKIGGYTLNLLDGLEKY